MNTFDELQNIWSKSDYPFLIHSDGELHFNDLLKINPIDLSEIKSGHVVALIGDFDPLTINTLLKLIDKNIILVPLTTATKIQHKYFFETSFVDFVIEGISVHRINHQNKHPLIEDLRYKKKGGLILFSTGTTGKPKAILHDLTLFMQRFKTPRPSHKTINFLLFDHIGGLNTLFHTLFNKGTIIAPKNRNVIEILNLCQKFNVEVLPTTPTFLRIMLLSGHIPSKIPKSLKIITYGTERMDQPTLDWLCKLLPEIEFRQTYGMSELGILRVKSLSKNSLYMKIGGEGINIKIKENILHIHSKNRMLGYLNSSDPFDHNGWYCTNDLVEEYNGYIKIIGRNSEVINIGGLKFMPSEIERVVLNFKGVEHVKVEGKINPITGQHIEMTIQPISNQLIDKDEIKNYLTKSLPRHMIPHRINITKINLGHRFKKI